MSSLKTLDRGYKVDEAINDPGKLVIIRFGPEGGDKYLSEVDEWLKKARDSNSEDVEAYTVATKDVPELVARYKLSPNITLLFFLRCFHIERLNLDANTDLQPYNENIQRWVEANKEIKGSKDPPIRIIIRYFRKARGRTHKPIS